MIVINNVEVSLVPVDLEFDPVLDTNFVYISTTWKSIAWNKEDNDYCILPFSLEELRIICDSD